MGRDLLNRLALLSLILVGLFVPISYIAMRYKSYRLAKQYRLPPKLSLNSQQARGGQAMNQNMKIAIALVLIAIAVAACMPRYSVTINNRNMCIRLDRWTGETKDCN